MSVAAALPREEPAAPSRQSLSALGWLNFFLAGMQTAFGPIVAAYLVVQEWTAKDIGFVLSIGSFAGLVSQVPGGGDTHRLPRSGPSTAGQPGRPRRDARRYKRTTSFCVRRRFRRQTP